MIRYALQCDQDHEFEAWFRSSAEYEKLSAAGANMCPLCESPKTSKAMMAPQVARTDKGSNEKITLAATPDPKHKAMLQAMRELRRKVTENADYVGPRFADEARKIHYNEVEPRGIYGEATTEDAKKLAEEGIDFAPLPQVPEERN
jgi:hypothetical protein